MIKGAKLIEFDNIPLELVEEAKALIESHISKNANRATERGASKKANWESSQTTSGGACRESRHVPSADTSGASDQILSTSTCTLASSNVNSAFAKSLLETNESNTSHFTNNKTLKSAPRMIHMCGIPGSGKTTYTSQFLSKNRSYCLVQFDAVMESLSGYQKDREAHGSAEAFSRWELPARAIGYHLLQALVENECNIFFDHSATNRQHLALIQAVQERGYVVEMHYIDCSPTEASLRVLEREQKVRRHTPQALIFERHELLKELVPSYEGLVDRFVRL